MTALVTGGARGIGAAVATRLVARGHAVVVADLDRARAEQTARRVGARSVACDVTDPDDLHRAIELAGGPAGRLDVLSLNAGGLFGTDLGEGFDLAAYRRHLSVHVDGVVLAVQGGLRALGAAEGSVLVTSSLAGLLTNDNSFYAAAKYALVGFVRSAAGPLAERGISINALCPGYTDTELLDDRARRWLDGQGLALASTAEVADAAERVLDSGRTGQAWAVQANRPAVAVPMPDIEVSRHEA